MQTEGPLGKSFPCWALQLPPGQHWLDIQTRTKWLVPKGLPPAGHPTCRLLGLSRVAPSQGYPHWGAAHLHQH